MRKKEWKNRSGSFTISPKKRWKQGLQFFILPQCSFALLTTHGTGNYLLNTNSPGHNVIDP